MAIPEDFLHYLWKFRLFDQKDLKTTCGQSIGIVGVGVHNTHSGPDFEGATIKIGDTLWAGNAEIHLRSSDWERHNHQVDKAYDNVILHVVGQHDQDIYRTDNTRIPVLSLEKLIPHKLTSNYLNLLECMDFIPCGRQISVLDEFYIKNWLYRVEIERLEEKAHGIADLLKEFKGGWDEAFYVSLARNFGFKINSIPFEMLARSLPQSLLGRYKNKPLQIESLIFGQAGFFQQKHKDQYPQELRKEYLFLEKKHSLVPMDNYLWKYLRMRPMNFPTIRLAQFAALIIRSDHLFSKIIKETEVSSIIKMFNDVRVNSYWKSHYRFGMESESASSNLGQQSVVNILINTVAVFLMAYGKATGSAEYVNRSILLLEELPTETNAIVNRFRDIGIRPESAFFSQSLIQLKKAYCDKKKCLSCGIGIKLLNI